jgi:hypothetical protein
MKVLLIVSTLGFMLSNYASAQTMPTTPTQPTLPETRTFPTQPNQLQRGIGHDRKSVVEDIQKRQFIERSGEGSERSTYRDAPQTGTSSNLPSMSGSSIGR